MHLFFLVKTYATRKYILVDLFELDMNQMDVLGYTVCHELWSAYIPPQTTENLAEIDLYFQKLITNIIN